MRRNSTALPIACFLPTLAGLLSTGSRTGPPGPTCKGRRGTSETCLPVGRAGPMPAALFATPARLLNTLHLITSRSTFRTPRRTARRSPLAAPGLGVAFLPASVRHTSARIAIPPICSGHIVLRAQAQVAGARRTHRPNEPGSTLNTRSWPVRLSPSTRKRLTGKITHLGLTFNELCCILMM